MTQKPSATNGRKTFFLEALGVIQVMLLAAMMMMMMVVAAR